MKDGSTSTPEQSPRCSRSTTTSFASMPTRFAPAASSTPCGTRRRRSPRSTIWTPPPTAASGNGQGSGRNVVRARQTGPSRTRQASSQRTSTALEQSGQRRTPANARRARGVHPQYGIAASDGRSQHGEAHGGKPPAGRCGESCGRASGVHAAERAIRHVDRPDQADAGRLVRARFAPACEYEHGCAGEAQGRSSDWAPLSRAGGEGLELESEQPGSACWR